MKLIDKDILIEEIERRYAEHDADYNNGDETELHRMVEDRAIIKYIDSLEVKEYSEEYDGFLGKELKMIDDEIARLEKLKVKEVENPNNAFIENACDAYCKVCGHYAHKTPTHICRQACEYYKDFKNYMKGE